MRNKFDQYIQYRALDTKFSNTNIPDSLYDEALDDAGEEAPIKNICAKLPIKLSDNLDRTVKVLGMSKRKFIELALIEAIARADNIMGEVDIRENQEEQQTRKRLENCMTEGELALKI